MVFADRLSKSKAHAEKASSFMPGGVNSNVRLNAVPVALCFDRGEGAYLFDLDGNRYVDYALGMGPNILGHAPKAVIDAVAADLSRGQLFGGQNERELELAQELKEAIPSAELVRLGMTGSEMVQAAIRLARAFTGRPRLVKFEGHYHGWFDNVLISVAPGAEALVGVPRPSTPQSDGQSEAAVSSTVVLPWNDLDALASYLAKEANQIAALLMEPIMGNTGVIKPRPGFMEGVRRLCDQYGVVLIFDEVIMGFRASLSGAQGLLGVKPDLSIFAKAIAAGFPVSAMAGRADIMGMIGTGRVNHSGTYNSNLVSMSAGVAAMRALKADGGAVYRQIDRTGGALIDGLREIAQRRSVALNVQGLPTVFNTAFTAEGPLHDYVEYDRADKKAQALFLELLLEEGVRPTSRGTWFLSSAHSDADIDFTLTAADNALAKLPKRLQAR